MDAKTEFVLFQSRVNQSCQGKPEKELIKKNEIHYSWCLIWLAFEGRWMGRKGKNNLTMIYFNAAYFPLFSIHSSIFSSCIFFFFFIFLPQRTWIVDSTWLHVLFSQLIITLVLSNMVVLFWAFSLSEKYLCCVKFPHYNTKNKAEKMKHKHW